VTDPTHPNWPDLDRLFRGDGFARGMGAELDDWGGGWSRVGWTPSAEHLNFGGVVHGGAVFGVGDYAFAVASNSWGRVAVALSVEVQFLRGVQPDTPLVAEGHERSRSRRTGAYLIEVRGPEQLVASLHAMVYRIDAWHLGADAWDEAWRASN
jgi:acyl-CoA thioesterase